MDLVVAVAAVKRLLAADSGVPRVSAVMVVKVRVVDTPRQCVWPLPVVLDVGNNGAVCVRARASGLSAEVVSTAGQAFKLRRPGALVANGGAA